MKKRTKIAAVSLAAVMACGLFAGCDLITTDPFKDYAQVVAEVNIGNNSAFAEGGEYAEYKGVVSTSEIYKRDLVASYASGGSSVMSQYGWTYADTFKAIRESLVNRAVYVQFAMVYLLDSNPEGESYTVSGYEAAVKDKSDLDADIDGVGYFLTAEEKAKALYDLRVSINGSLDSLEQAIIEQEDDHDHDETVRTTPTGIDTEDEDFCDEAYRIYTGTETSLGSYEKVPGSTVTTRRKAYAQYLTNIRSAGLLAKGEDTSKIEGLDYFRRELKSAYEGALIEKLGDIFEKEGSDKVTDAWLSGEFAAMLENQNSGFDAGTTSIDDALDSMSDTSFVLTAPVEGYGFVLNILLPFSTTQTQELSDIARDPGDVNGNKFVSRTAILSRVKATDQRGTWFTGHDDYSWESEGYTGTLDNTADRTYLFFENSLSAEKAGEKNQYELLKNYLGKYTYNGTVTVEEEEAGHRHYKLTPKKIGIDDFIAEMEGYLTYAGLTVGDRIDKREGYFEQTDYYKGGSKTDVDYEKFVYYSGKVEFEGGFNANEMFVAGSEENLAFSVMNELSFAYNTDTAGLNTYLGYAVTPYKTSFVKEFEYAAQKVCKEGAGNYIVVPTDYGWHIIYCTFSFTEAGVSPFAYDASQRDAEGSFSNLFYEAKKAQAASTYSNNKQTEFINKFSEGSSKVYEDRYADLSNLG